MTIHDNIDNFLTADLHGDLSEDERSALHAHFTDCAACRKLHQETKLMDKLLEENLAQEKPDAAFEQRMLAGFRTRIPERSRFTGWLVDLMRSRAVQITAVVAGLLGFQIGRMITREGGTTPSTLIQIESPGVSISAAAFKQLASLVGEWQGVQDGVPVKVIYTLAANGTALMEQMQPANSAETMITMFTVDGDHLIATHYCSNGNQPQMVTNTIGNLEKDGVTFSLVRVTGMKTSEDWHNTGLTVTLDDKDHITQRWSYLYKGKTGTNIMHYARVKKSL
jgi:predicted anti-sigma-YlaC factor YlaD